VKSRDSDRKVCSQCQVDKPITEYNFRNRSTGLRHSYCRDCGKMFTASHYKHNKRQYLDRNTRAYAKRREYVRQAKSRPCVDCGVEYPYYVMDFDHRDGDSKIFALNCVDRVTMKAIKLEIEKCDVVCANCHRKRTYQRRVKASGTK
jgi:hypothetical protein